MRWRRALCYVCQQKGKSDVRRGSAIDISIGAGYRPAEVRIRSATKGRRYYRINITPRMLVHLGRRHDAAQQPAYHASLMIAAGRHPRPRRRARHANVQRISWGAQSSWRCVSVSGRQREMPDRHSSVKLGPAAEAEELWTCIQSALPRWTQ